MPTSSGATVRIAGQFSSTLQIPKKNPTISNRIMGKSASKKKKNNTNKKIPLLAHILNEKPVNSHCSDSKTNKPRVHFEKLVNKNAVAKSIEQKYRSRRNLKRSKIVDNTATPQTTSSSWSSTRICIPTAPAENTDSSESAQFEERQSIQTLMQTLKHKFNSSPSMFNRGDASSTSERQVRFVKDATAQEVKQNVNHLSNIDEEPQEFDDANKIARNDQFHSESHVIADNNAAINSDLDYIAGTIHREVSRVERDAVMPTPTATMELLLSKSVEKRRPLSTRLHRPRDSIVSQTTHTRVSNNDTGGAAVLPPLKQSFNTPSCDPIVYFDVEPVDHSKKKLMSRFSKPETNPTTSSIANQAHLHAGREQPRNHLTASDQIENERGRIMHEIYLDEMIKSGNSCDQYVDFQTTASAHSINNNFIAPPSRVTFASSDTTVDTESLIRKAIPNYREPSSKRDNNVELKRNPHQGGDIVDDGEGGVGEVKFTSLLADYNAEMKSRLEPLGECSVGGGDATSLPGGQRKPIDPDYNEIYEKPMDKVLERDSTCSNDRNEDEGVRVNMHNLIKTLHKASSFTIPKVHCYLC